MSKRRRIVKNACHTPMVVELESRLLLATPSSPRANTLPWFDTGERSEMLERMDNLASQSTLRTQLQSSTTTFDNSLLAAMRNRSSVHFYFDPGSSNMSTMASFMNLKLSSSTAATIASADLTVDQRLFKGSNNDGTKTVTLAGDINWADPGVNVTGFPLVLNGLDTWREMTEAAWFSGNQSKYMDELRYELADWSDAFRTVTAPPASWTADDQSGWFFNSAARAEVMTWAYFTALGSSSWTAADNTLMLYKLMQHGDYLYSVAQTLGADDSIDSNRTLTVAKSLTLLGRMFPEFDNAQLWEDEGRSLLFATMDAQVYPDGSHVEQSPGYTLGVVEDLLESYWLDQLNGDTAAWSGTRVNTLKKAMESYRQFLSPDGKRPGIGDTYRIQSVTVFLKAGLILDTINASQSVISGQYSNGETVIGVDDASHFNVGDLVNVANKNEVMKVTGVNLNGDTLTIQRAVAGTSLRTVDDNQIIYDMGDQPVAKPRVRDVWLFGVAAMTPFANLPATPSGALGDRGQAYAMPDSGNYVLRSDGDSSTATQIIFDAGPKGGIHGHSDLLNFELWSDGRPLIIDPGPYKYDNSADRAYVQSTKAHNTINVDGLDVGALEGEFNPSIKAAYDFEDDFALVTGTHWGYSYLPGSPVVTRNIWYNYGDTMLIVDFVEGTRARNYQQSFNLPGDATANPTGVQPDGSFKTRYGDGLSNVRVVPLNGGTSVRALTFVTSADQSGDYKDDAYRYTISKNDDFAVFATLVQVYNGLTVPNVTATVTSSSNPTPGQPVTIQLDHNGAISNLSFSQPNTLQRLPSTGPNNAGENSVQYDSSGDLHMAYQDRVDGFLKYTVRDSTTSKWSIPQIIDNSNKYLGAPDLTLDNNGDPGVAYFDGNAGDLKYAHLSGSYHSWQVETVDSKKSVGQYPSLAYSKSGNGALIAYYVKATGDLRVAQQNSTWTIDTIDSTGDVGRFTNIILDPNRPDLNSRYVIGYEDTSSSAAKYAYYNGSSWHFEKVDPGIDIMGGYVSMTMVDTGVGTVGQAGSNRFQPRLSWYESLPDPSLWYAARSSDGTWATQRLDGKGSGKSGQYSRIFTNSAGRPEIYYLDYKANQLKHAVNTGGSNWTLSVVNGGGRAVSVSSDGTHTAVAALDDLGGFKVTVL